MSILHNESVDTYLSYMSHFSWKNLSRKTISWTNPLKKHSSLTWEHTIHINWKLFLTFPPWTWRRLLWVLDLQFRQSSIWVSLNRTSDNTSILISIVIFSKYFALLELSHKLRARPEKRVGGGGYGSMKNMNRDDQKKRKFKQINGGDSRSKKFTRWTDWKSS